MDAQLTLPDRNGQSHTIVGRVPQVTVVNLMATWAKLGWSDVVVLNEFSSLHKTNSDYAVRVVGIVLDDSRSTFQTFADANRLNYMLLWRANSAAFSATFEKWMHRAPSTVVIRPDSTVCTVIVGRASLDVLKAVVKAAAIERPSGASLMLAR